MNWGIVCTILKTLNGINGNKKSPYKYCIAISKPKIISPARRINAKIKYSLQQLVNYISYSLLSFNYSVAFTLAFTLDVILRNQQDYLFLRYVKLNCGIFLLSGYSKGCTAIQPCIYQLVQSSSCSTSLKYIHKFWCIICSFSY